MNQFYLKLFDIACRYSSPTEDDISNKENIISVAISKLSKENQDFIRMLKPVDIDLDPHGINSKHYVSNTVIRLKMNHKQIKERKDKIRKELINQIIALLPPMDKNS